MLPIRIKACSESDLRMLGDLARNIQRVLPVTQADIDAAAALGKEWVVWKVIEVTDPIDNLRGGTQLVIKQNSILPGQNVHRVLIVSGPGGETVVIGPGPSPLLLPDAIADSLQYVKAFGGTEQRNIPQPYTQVNYVTNTAQTAVDTGIMIDFAKNYEFEVECRATTGSWYILQSRASASGNVTGIHGETSGSTIKLVVGNVTVCTSAITRTVGNKLYVKATLNAGTATLYVKDETANTEDTQTGSYGTSQPNPTAAVYLLGNAGGQYADINSDIYMARIKENDTVVMDYVPARQVATAGFYDKASGTFKTALTPANLSADGNTVPTPDAPMDIVSNNGVVKHNGLPEGYTRLEYIQASNSNNGGSYIDTGLTRNNSDFVFETDIEFTSLTGSARGAVAGAMWTYSAYLAIDPVGRFDVGSSYYTSAISLNTKYKVKTEFLSSSIIISLYDASGTLISTTTRPNNSWAGTNPNSWLIGYCRNIASTNVFAFTVRLSNSKIYRNGTLDFNGIPCKNASNIVGMYDTVSKTFFGNSGTGDFTASTTEYPNIYTDGTVETIKDSLNNIATAEMLLKVGDYQDVQSIIDGVVTRNVGVKVLDGTEEWGEISNGRGYWFPMGVLQETYTSVIGFCSHFSFYIWDDNVFPMPVNNFGFNKNVSTGKTNGNITFRPDLTVYSTVDIWKQYLADQYAAGTPVIVVYPLATATTESVTGQTLQVQAGDNVLEITQASLDNLELEAEYEKTV